MTALFYGGAHAAESRSVVVVGDEPLPSSGPTARIWRRLKPFDEAAICRAFAAWDGPRRAIGHWVEGPGLPYADCIRGVSVQLVSDRGDDYRSPCRADEARALVANEAVCVLAGCDRLCVAADPASPRSPHIDPFEVLGDALTWLHHCGARGDVETGVLLAGTVEEAVISLDHRPPDLYPIAWA